MTSEEQKRYINYPADRVNAADLENRAMKLVLQDFLDKQKADAECAIHPLITRCNAMLHFDSDEGAEMAATYHSIICTVKIQRRFTREYPGKFFTKILNGCRDFYSLRPDKIGLAICQ